MAIKMGEQQKLQNLSMSLFTLAVVPVSVMLKEWKVICSVPLWHYSHTLCGVEIKYANILHAKVCN